MNNNLDETGRWVQSLIDENNLDAFYFSWSWKKLRKEVMEEHKFECQECKKKGRYKRANLVHHVMHVDKHPRFALSKTYKFQGVEHKNLIPICKECHEMVCHPERLRWNKKE